VAGPRAADTAGMRMPVARQSAAEVLCPLAAQLLHDHFRIDPAGHAIM